MRPSIRLEITTFDDQFYTIINMFLQVVCQHAFGF